MGDCKPSAIDYTKYPNLPSNYPLKKEGARQRAADYPMFK